METFERESIHYVLKSRLSRLAPVIQHAIQEAEERREYREREQRLRRDEEHLRALLDSIKDYAIFRLDREGCVSRWSAGAEWIKGYAADEIMGQHFSCFYPADTVANGHPARALTEAMAQGRFREETLLLRKGGIPFWADVLIVSLSDAPEHLRDYTLVVHDITARKEMEAEREQVVQELQSTLHNVKILSGLLPICGSCKKVRDYQGQWHSLEVYLQEHSEAVLAHEFCDECAMNIQSASAEI